MTQVRSAKAGLAVLLATSILASPAFAQTTGGLPASAGLEQGFLNPPNSARPRVWWHWMNGNISKEGIRQDIDWMSRVGIGGLQNFDAALETPQVVDKRLVYMTPEWKDAFRYAAGLAQEKGLELTVAASPGWSETGGPWVKPADGMKKLVWSETVVAGGRALTAPLAAPPNVTGPFQDIGFARNFAAADLGRAPPQFFQDVAVLAYRVPDEAKPLLSPKLSANGTPLTQGDQAADGKYQTGVEVPLGASTSYLTADFGSAQTVRSVSLAIAGGAGIFVRTSLRPVLEAEDGQGGWRKVADLPLDGGVQTTVSFAPVTAKTFRVALAPIPPAPDAGSFLGSVPGAVILPLFDAKPKATATVSELRFYGEPRVDRAEVKAGFGLVEDYYALGEHAPPEASGVAPGAVLDLTSKMSADGRLDWRAPPGRWKILRLGYSLVGTTNHPAPVEATGLEVDKYDGVAVKNYLETYLAMVRGAAGPDLFGQQGVRAVLTDSIEVGASNWTGDLIAKFQSLRGYDPRPWLPALTGEVIGSRAQSDAFLYDFRRTLADLIASQHYGQVAATAHENGLKVYGEALESGRPSLGDDMAMRRHADIPMAALWTYALDKTPRWELVGDMKGAASVAHIYGQNLAAAESLTAAFSPWAFAPSDLQPIIDLEFASGINRPVIHTSVHQPTEKAPGLSLGPFGQYFNRHDTWAEMAKPWVDYLSRSAYLLQQGRNYADVAYFYGEDSPVTVLYRSGPPADLPKRYAFDFVNPDVVLDQLSVQGHDLVAKSGASYRVLYLGGSSPRMTLPVLKRLGELARGGATIVGKAPTSSPSLKDDPAAFAALVHELWSGAPTTQVGQGRVIATQDVEQALQDLGVEPDFDGGQDAKDHQTLFVHRRLADGDVYFLTNRENRILNLQARFAVTGRAPEIWRADTGRGQPVSYKTDGATTVVPLTLAPRDSFFVVFRRVAPAPAQDIAQTQWAPLAAKIGPWNVSFEEGRGAPAGATLAALAPLNENADAGVKYFSGVATYRSTLTVPKALPKGAPVMLDLGRVGDVAEVRVNGQSLGYAWRAPYQIDVGAALRPGANQLEVRVANLWVNRLVGDAQPGTKPVAFTTLPTYKADAPLRPSGLIGPVQLLAPTTR
jgi:hypothetical protein